MRCTSLSWTAQLPDGPAQFSLRPENIRLASGETKSAGVIRVRGRVLQQAFHGATELVRVECAEQLILTVRIPGGSATLDTVELEFSPPDAVPVRDSPERI